MSKKGDIYLGPAGSLILLTPFGRKYSEADVELSKEERTVSGKLVKDIIAVKKQFRLSYDSIDGDDLIDILTLYDLQAELTLQIQHTDDPPTTTPEPGNYYDEYTVLMEPIGERMRLILMNTGIWENAIVVLNEV